MWIAVTKQNLNLKNYIMNSELILTLKYFCFIILDTSWTTKFKNSKTTVYPRWIQLINFWLLYFTLGLHNFYSAFLNTNICNLWYYLYIYINACVSSRLNAVLKMYACIHSINSPWWCLCFSTLRLGREDCTPLSLEWQQLGCP